MWPISIAVKIKVKMNICICDQPSAGTLIIFQCHFSCSCSIFSGLISEWGISGASLSHNQTCTSFFFSQNRCRGIQELKDQSIWWIKMLKPRSKHQYSISLLRMQLKMKKIVRIERGYRQLWVKSIRKVDRVGLSGAWKWVNRGRMGSTLLPD